MFAILLAGSFALADINRCPDLFLNPAPLSPGSQFVEAIRELYSKYDLATINLDDVAFTTSDQDLFPDNGTSTFEGTATNFTFEMTNPDDSEIEYYKIRVKPIVETRDVEVNQYMRSSNLEFSSGSNILRYDPGHERQVQQTYEADASALQLLTDIKDLYFEAITEDGKTIPGYAFRIDPPTFIANKNHESILLWFELRLAHHSKIVKTPTTVIVEQDMYKYPQDTRRSLEVRWTGDSALITITHEYRNGKIVEYLLKGSKSPPVSTPKVAKLKPGPRPISTTARPQPAPAPPSRPHTPTYAERFENSRVTSASANKKMIQSLEKLNAEYRFTVVDEESHKLGSAQITSSKDTIQFSLVGLPRDPGTRFTLRANGTHISAFQESEKEIKFIMEESNVKRSFQIPVGTPKQKQQMQLTVEDKSGQRTYLIQLDPLDSIGFFRRFFRRLATLSF